MRQCCLKHACRQRLPEERLPRRQRGLGHVGAFQICGKHVAVTGELMVGDGRRTRPSDGCNLRDIDSLGQGVAYRRELDARSGQNPCAARVDYAAAASPGVQHEPVTECDEWS